MSAQWCAASDDGASRIHVGPVWPHAFLFLHSPVRGTIRGTTQWAAWLGWREAGALRLQLPHRPTRPNLERVAPAGAYFQALGKLFGTALVDDEHVIAAFTGATELVFTP